MFEIIANLILTGLFLQSQLKDNSVLAPAISVDYNLPQAENRQTAVWPRRNSEIDSLGVEVTAQSFLVADEASGRVLYEKNALEKRSIASITKLMTALVFLDHNPGWNSEITVQAEDYRPGGITYLIAGERLSVWDVFHASLIASSNEATVVLARSTGLSEEEFVRQMNGKAAAFGMAATTFEDETGLAGGNESTAADVVLLLKNALADPQIYGAISSDAYDLDILNRKIRRHIVSTDKILGNNFGFGGKNYRVAAGKTGYLEKAGYCFASRIASDSGQKLLIAVLGSQSLDDRFNDTKSLAYWVFKNYLWQ